MDNIEEFSKKYNSTWIRYISPSKGKPVPVVIESISLGDESFSLTSRDIGSVTLSYTEANLRNNVILDPPEPGYFNHNGHALVLFKTPARQWRRGFCSDNHEIYNPFRKLLRDGVYRPGFGVLTVHSIFDPKYATSPEEARQKLEVDHQSIALTKHLMLSKSPVADKPYPLVWFDCEPVGFMRGDRFIIDDNIFQQEVEDELHRAGYNWNF